MSKTKPFNVEFTFRGKELRRKLKTMPVDLRRRVTKEAVRAGANVIRKQAKWNVKAKFQKYATGTLAKNIGMQMKVRNVGIEGEVSINIGPTKHAWYGRLLETGTRSFSAKPWLRPAFDTKKEEAVRVCAGVFFRYFNTV